jgi:nucleoside-diphosphate-sugar epimerase
VTQDAVPGRATIPRLLATRAYPRHAKRILATQAYPRQLAAVAAGLGAEEADVKRALVIGGTGPTGPFIVGGLLARGFEVAILHRGEHEIDEIPPEVEHLHTDPFSGDALDAALSGRSFELAIATYGRLREVARVLRGRTPRLIGIGGVPLYHGWRHPDDLTPNGLPVPTREDAPLVESEREHRKGFRIRRTEEAVFAAHPSATLLRYPYVYGPRQLLPREWCILRRILDGRRFIVLGDGGLTLSTYGYAENLAHAVLLAVDHPEAAAGRAYNCGDEQVWSLRQVVETIARIQQHPLEILSLPGDLALPAQPMLAHERTLHRVMDLSRIRHELGYRDLVAPAEGLRRTVAWLLANRPEPGGPTERLLGDTFDYAAEDRLAAIHRDYVARLRDVEYSERPGPGLSYDARDPDDPAT